MNQVRVTSIALIAVGAACVLLMAGCGGHQLLTEGSSDQALVTLHGYTFGSQSNHINHPWTKVDPTVGLIKYPGWGTAAGSTMRAAFSNGGLVAGVKTVKWVNSGVPGWTVHTEWWAQDKAGNVHLLQHQDGTAAPRAVGVAVGPHPSFVLRRDRALAKGATWWDYFSPDQAKKTEQHKVLSRAASVRGASGLLLEQCIDDGNRDGVFDPSLSGPDSRWDLYFDSTGPLWTIKVGAKGGYTRQ